MKKFVIFNVVLGIGLICTIIAFAMNVTKLDFDWLEYNSVYNAFGNSTNPDHIRQLNEIYSDCVKETVIHVLNAIGMVSIFAILCIKDIPAIKKYFSLTKEQRNANKLSRIQQREQNKAEKEQQQAERAEAKKQQRIAEIQAELEELKKD